MQGSFSCIPSIMAAIEATISPARLARFSRATGGDKQFALRLYVWNSRLCEEFYLPLQMAEVTLRNAIAKVLTRRFSRDWYIDPSFTSLLTVRYRDELSDVYQKEMALRGLSFTVDDIIGGMTFGFWVHMLTTRYEGTVWAGNIAVAFPNAPAGTTLAGIQHLADNVRKFRNKVMHQLAIYDQSPKNNFMYATGLIRLSCIDTFQYVSDIRSIDKAIGLKPRS